MPAVTTAAGAMLVVHRSMEHDQLLPGCFSTSTLHGFPLLSRPCFRPLLLCCNAAPNSGPGRSLFVMFNLVVIGSCLLLYVHLYRAVQANIDACCPDGAPAFDMYDSEWAEQD